MVYTDNMVNASFTHPHTRKKWHFGIRAGNGKLVALMLTSCDFICIGNESIKFITGSMMYHTKYKGKRLPYMLIKELMRRANLHKINQLLLSSNRLLMPVTTVTQWVYWFDNPTSRQLPSSPRTPGWRRMTSEDVPSALALINKWSSQFEIRQAFKGKEEFAHHFLLSKLVFTYVVVGINNDDITDLVSYMYTPIQVVSCLLMLSFLLQWYLHAVQLNN